MTFTATTIFVLFANGLTAIVTAALLMLVLFQAPQRRMNQYFALAMLMLGSYSVANAFGRFIDDLRLDPVPTTYIAVALYGVFVVTMFFFASEFAQTYTRTTRAMRVVGLTLVVVQNGALWGGLVVTNIRPTTDQSGSYLSDWTTYGQGLVVTSLTYLVVTAVVLYRMPDERGRSLWKAPVLVIAGLFSYLLIWPAAHLPLQALFLALAALALGLPVLRYELFNPLANVHAELAQRNLDLNETSRLKSQFLANMSHELRTPLNSIIGYTELVLNGTYGALNDTQHDRLEKVIRNGHNLLGLINDVLDLNRIESGHVSLNLTRVTTPDLLDSVLDLMQPLAAKKGLVITRDYAQAPAVFADAARLRQILTNITANAVKFTHQGGVTVRARADSDHVRFEIADTGIGIALDQIDTVFAEFRQIDNSTTREYEGTGLGMAITKRLVEMHGGRIWLESTPGEGTTFFVTMPTTRPSPERTAARAA